MFAIRVREVDGLLKFTLLDTDLMSESQFNYLTNSVQSIYNRGLIDTWYYSTDLSELRVYDLILRRVQ